MGLKQKTVNRWNLVEAYLHLTKKVLPTLAQSGGKQAHVREVVSKLVDKRFVSRTENKLVVAVDM